MTRIVTVTRRFSVSPERVFDAFLDPAIAGRFMFATPAGQMVRVEIEPKVGGAYTFVDRRDGEDIEHAGRILELDRPGRLAFEFSVPKYDPRMTTVRLDIMADGTGSLLTLTHEGVDDAYLEQTGKGWTMILETAAASLE
ncbi:MAG: SRPBCC domain-containing protein [Phenylobacterium sp.]|nr:SRPBCC domain-containing protein [Phenylobacterium sp.]MBP8247266.1 SRPBCC domain-containing protein [Phenylobacterium sp.]